METLKVGDYVCYSSAWLRSCGIYVGDICFATGKIINIKEVGRTQLAVVQWNREDIPEKVNIVNLIRADQKHLEPR